MEALFKNVSTDKPYLNELDKIDKSEWGDVICGKTLLLQACYRKNKHVALELLIEPSLCNLPHMDGGKNTAFTVACMHKLEMVALEILKHTCEFNILWKNSTNMDSIELCVQNSLDLVGEKLIEKYPVLANNFVASKHFSNNMSLMPKTFNKIFTVCDKNDKDDNYKTSTLNTLLKLFCTQKRESHALYMLDSFDENMIGNLNTINSLLMIAHNNDLKKAVLKIISISKNSLNQVDSDGHTLLMNLFLWKDTPITEERRLYLAELLLTCDLDLDLGLDIVDECNMTALMYACSYKIYNNLCAHHHQKIILLLVQKYKSNLETVNSSGEDAFDMCYQFIHNDTFYAFIGVMVTDPEKYRLWRMLNNKSIFIYVVDKKCYDIATKLILIDPDKCNSWPDYLGTTILMKACELDNTEHKQNYDKINLAISLLSHIHICNLHKSNCYGNTALISACMSCTRYGNILVPVITKILSYPDQCNMGHINKKNETALQIMIKFNPVMNENKHSQLIIVKKLLSFPNLCGLDSITDYDTILSFVCDNGMKSQINKIIDHFSPNIKDKIITKYLDNPIVNSLVKTLNYNKISEQINNLQIYKTKVNQYKQDHDSITKKSSCLICYDDTINSSFYKTCNCSHIFNLCDLCKATIEKHSCPICRSSVGTLNKVYVIE